MSICYSAVIENCLPDATNGRSTAKYDMKKCATDVAKIWASHSHFAKGMELRDIFSNFLLKFYTLYF